MTRAYKSHWSEDDKAKLFSLRKKKHTWMQIGKELGRSYTACRNQYKALQKNPEYKNGVRIPRSDFLARFGLTKEMVRKALATPFGKQEPLPSPEAIAALNTPDPLYTGSRTIGGRKSCLDILGG